MHRNAGEAKGWTSDSTFSTDGELAVIVDGEVVALDVDTGEILWRTGGGREDPRYLGRPSIDGSRVYASRDDGFAALRAR